MMTGALPPPCQVPTLQPVPTPVTYQRIRSIFDRIRHIRILKTGSYWHSPRINVKKKKLCHITQNSSEILMLWFGTASGFATLLVSGFILWPGFFNTSKKYRA